MTDQERVGYFSGKPGVHVYCPFCDFHTFSFNPSVSKGGNEYWWHLEQHIYFNHPREIGKYKFHYTFKSRESK